MFEFFSKICVFLEIDVLRTTVDMFVAGRDNLMVSTKWILMALVKYPDVQSKCRSEIHEVCQVLSVSNPRRKKEELLFK